MNEIFDIPTMRAHHEHRVHELSDVWRRRRRLLDGGRTHRRSSTKPR